MNGKWNRIFWLSTLAAAAFAGVCFYSQWSAMREENEELAAALKSLYSRLENLRDDCDKKNEYYNRLVSDADFAERVIRERLGYAYPEDIVFRFKDSEPADIDDFDAPDTPAPKREKTLFERIVAFFGFGADTPSNADSSATAANNSAPTTVDGNSDSDTAQKQKPVAPELRIDMTNASIAADENRQKRDAANAPTLSFENGGAASAASAQTSPELQMSSTPAAGFSATLPPETYVLLADRGGTSGRRMTAAQSRPVAVKLGGTNSSVRFVSARAAKPVRFVDR